jgi:hypothetical protein
MPEPRKVAYEQLDTWLEDYLGAAFDITTETG